MEQQNNQPQPLIPTALELVSQATIGRRNDLLMRIRQIAGFGIMGDFTNDPTLPKEMVDELMYAALVFKRKMAKEEKDGAAVSGGTEQ
jgi:hypothetical protein